MWTMTVFAHATGPEPSPWPVVTTAAALVVVAAAYLAGIRVLGHGDVSRGVRRQGRLRVVAFGGGLLALGVALLPPLDTAADERFVAHMSQHMVLVVVAAPLIAFGAPGLPALLTLPVRWRQWLARRLHRVLVVSPARVLALPVTAWLLHIGVLWAWHMPAAYDAALHSEAVHVLEHLSFLVTAWLLWWHLATPGALRVRGPVAALYMFATLLPSAALGAVLTLARIPLYDEQAARAAHAGVDPLADQQLAGLVMWIPADVVYLVAILGFVFAWAAGRGRRDVAAPGGPGDPLDPRTGLLPPEEVSR